MRKKLTGVAAALSLTVLTLPAAASANASTTAQSESSGTSMAKAAAAAKVKWATCASASLKTRGAQCAKISVPLDYKKPRGKKVKIAISRIKHTVPASQYQGVMLVNPGGPGGSGLTLSVLGEYVPKNAGKAYDWIGFDPRGVGSSTPAVSCDAKYAGYNRPQYVPRTNKIVKAWMKITHKYTKRCDARNGAILDHLTTIDSAKDMDRIRKALNQKKINYYGFSYGTYLGQVYSSRYPERVRRMVFDGTVDPRGVWYKANLDQDVAFDRNINIWFGWVAKYDSTYHLGNTEAKVRSLFYKTQAQLYKKPVKAKGGKLGGSEWTDAFLNAGYYQSTWTDLASTFSRFINSKDVGALEASYLDASGYGDDNGYAVYLGVQCTDTKWPTSWKKWKKDNAKIYKVAPFETWSNAWYNEPCRHWPAKSRTPQKINGKKVKSLLMINETLDAATPYTGSLQVRKLYPKARLIAVPGGTTHSNSLNGNECVDNAIADYLLTGKRPARKSGKKADATCAALPRPVPTAAQRKLQSQAPDVGTTRLDMQKIAVRR